MGKWLKSDIQKVDGPRIGTSRPETGPMQFGDDWPGVFIRGDNAFMYAMGVAHAIENMGEDRIAKATLRGLLDLLQSCDVRNHAS